MKPTHEPLGSSPRNVSELVAAAARGVVDGRRAVALDLAPGGDARAQDLRVERAREPAVGRDQQQRHLSCDSCSRRIGSLFISPLPAASAAWRVIRRSAFA